MVCIVVYRLNLLWACFTSMSLWCFCWQLDSSHDLSLSSPAHRVCLLSTADYTVLIFRFYYLFLLFIEFSSTQRHNRKYLAVPFSNCQLSAEENKTAFLQMRSLMGGGPVRTGSMHSKLDIATGSTASYADTGSGMLPEFSCPQLEWSKFLPHTARRRVLVRGKCVSW